MNCAIFSILPVIIACKVALEQSGTICVYTFPSRLSSPNTFVFPDAPLPLLPLTLLAQKYDSSTSISPFTGDSDSQCSAIFCLIFFNILYIVVSLIFVNFDILLASKSREKYLIISLNLASDSLHFA